MGERTVTGRELVPGLVCAALLWLVSSAGVAAVLPYVPAGLAASASMLITGGLCLALRRLGGGGKVRWRREHWPIAAVSGGLYGAYMVLSAYWTALAGLRELTVSFSLQCLTLLIGLSLVKDLYIRPRTVLSVAVTAVGAVCAMELGTADSLLLWCLVPLGLLLAWTLWLILTLDLAEEYPLRFTVGWQNVLGGLMALPVAIFDPAGIAVPDGGAALLFAAGACLWSGGLPLLLGRLKGRTPIAGSVVFGAIPVCGLLGWKLVGEGLSSGLHVFGLGLLCVGVVLACLDMLGIGTVKE